jgi:hypothetical protein
MIRGARADPLSLRERVGVRVRRRQAWPLLLVAACAGAPDRAPPRPDVCALQPAGLLCTIAGIGVSGGGPDGPALQTPLYHPTSASFTPDGRLLIADYNNNRVRVLEDGELTTLVGVGVHGMALDGALARSTMLENPIDAVMAPDGALFVQEQHGARILRVDPETDRVWTYVGSASNPGYEGYEGDGGFAANASMSQGGGLALADDGTLYFADTGNHCIRRVALEPFATGEGGEVLVPVIDTVAGDGIPGHVDGFDARFERPIALAVRGDSLYVVEDANHAVRRVDLGTGEVTPVAGTGVAGFSGDGGPATEAQLAGPRGIGLGPDGAIFVADSDNDVIRRIDADGTIETVAGVPGQSGDNGDGRAPTESLLSWPSDVALSPDGDLIVVDMFNARIRAVRAWAHHGG